MTPVPPLQLGVFSKQAGPAGSSSVPGQQLTRAVPEKLGGEGTFSWAGEAPPTPILCAAWDPLSHGNPPGGEAVCLDPCRCSGPKY